MTTSSNLVILNCFILNQHLLVTSYVKSDLSKINLFLKCTNLKRFNTCLKGVGVTETTHYSTTQACREYYNEAPGDQNITLVRWKLLTLKGYIWP